MAETRRRAWSRYAPIVQGTLTLFGFPGLLTATLSTTTGVVNALPKGNRALDRFAETAVDQFAVHCSGEAAGVSEMDRQAVESRLETLLATGERRKLLGAALLGQEEFLSALVGDGAVAYSGLGDDGQGYLDSLVNEVYGIVRAFAQSPEVLGLATTGALRDVKEALTEHPTKDQVAVLIDAAVKAVSLNRQEVIDGSRLSDQLSHLVNILENPVAPLATVPVVVGEPPPLAAAYQYRPLDRQRIDIAWSPGADGPGVTCVFLTGDGGVGKSQLAAGVFRDSGCDATVRVWVSASSERTLLAGYAAAADSVGATGAASPARRLRGGDSAEGVAVGAAGVDDQDLITVRARGFLEWLAGPGRDRAWLVVLDDLWLLPEVMCDLMLWPPETPRGRVLVTTRRRQAAFDALCRQMVPMDVFTPVEAQSYLRSRLQDHWQGADLSAVLEDAAALVDDLGRLPVALAQAAAVLIDTRITCQAYRRQFHDLSRSLPSLFPTGTRPAGYSLTVSTTWSLAIDQADRKEPVGLARPAGQLAAVIDPSGCPGDLWRTRAARAYLGAHRAAGGRPGSAIGRRGPSVISAEDTATALAALNTLSVVTLSGVSPADEVRIHPLAQRAIRDTLESDNQLDETVVAAADALAELWPSVENDRPRILTLQANAAHLTGVGTDALWAPCAHPLLFRAGGSLGRLGLMAQARDYFEDLFVVAKRKLGDAHRSTLSARSSWAFWLGRAGDPEGATAAFEVLVAECEATLGAVDAETLAVRANLARFRGQSGHPERAVADCRSLQLVCADALGPDDPLALVVRHNLAHWLAKTGDFEGAVAGFEGVLGDRQRVLGVDHPETLVTRNDLAFNRGSAGAPDRAVADLEAVLAARTKVLGPDHPETLVTRTDLAWWRARATDWAGAADEYAALLDDDLRVVGPDHSYTLRARIQLAVAKGWDGDPARVVVAELESVLRDCKRVLGPGHQTTEAAYSSLVEWQARAVGSRT